jgi:hypothetical protein
MSITKYTVALSLAILATGCATQPARIAQTTSGHPEVVIPRADSVDAVKSRLIERLMNAGWQLDQETASRVAFSKEMTGGQAVAAQLVLGNADSSTPRWERAYTLVKAVDGVRIYATSSMSTVMPFGKVNRVELTSNNEFNDQQASLERLRDSF